MASRFGATKTKKKQIESEMRQGTYSNTGSLRFGTKNPSEALFDRGLKMEMNKGMETKN